MRIKCFTHETPIVMFHGCNLSSFVSLMKQNELNYLLIRYQRGFAAPLDSLQEGNSKGMRASTHASFSFVAVTTTEFNSKALLFIPRPLIKTIRGFRGINRTLRARGLTVEHGYS